MDGQFILGAVALIAVLTTATVEALKKLLNDKQIQYSANALAAAVSVILALASSVGYLVYTDTAFTWKILVVILAIAYLSFLAAMIGFDKLKQMLAQLKG